MNTTLELIMRITGREPTSCSCKTCQNQCRRSPCLGTPEDIEKIVDAGYVAEIVPTIWAVGMTAGVLNFPLPMFQANQTPHGCIFFKDGLCLLHDKGLKPTEGKLSYHTIQEDNLVFEKSLTWQVAKQWLQPVNLPVILRLAGKLKPYHP